MQTTEKTEIKFINHASILVSYGNVSLLSDPWYQGDAFHKGWSLLRELSDNEVVEVLTATTHIWVSHEHPDHFSILFFKKFGKLIKERKIQLLFQATDDKRVESFLEKMGFDLKIVTFSQWYNLSDTFQVLCVKDGFYDSGLVIQTSDMKIINLNDCEVNTPSRCEEVLALTGKCDVLLTQFSYAAWKGGKENQGWRRSAAQEKISTMLLQTKYFQPKVVVPFASYMYFSNKDNFYLNDSANTPRDILNSLDDSNAQLKIMEMFENLTLPIDEVDNSSAIEFWDTLYKINSDELLGYSSVSLDELVAQFMTYRKRVSENNSMLFMRFLSLFSPIKVFQPVLVNLHDLNKTLEINIFRDCLHVVDKPADISMHSESLSFIFSNTFGFDTLTVNGCFEECSDGGFSRATKTLAVENLNNLGYRVSLSLLVNIKLIKLFLSKLYKVSKKLRISN